MKKNCLNCKFLEYVEEDTSDGNGSGGYCCTGRDYSLPGNNEDRHLDQLEDERYLRASKKCFFPHEEKKENV